MRVAYTRFRPGFGIGAVRTNCSNFAFAQANRCAGRIANTEIRRQQPCLVAPSDTYRPAADRGTVLATNATQETDIRQSPENEVSKRRSRRNAVPPGIVGRNRNRNCRRYRRLCVLRQNTDTKNEVRLLPSAFHQPAGTFHCALQHEPYSIVPFGLALPSFHPPKDNSSADVSFQIPVRKPPQI